MSGREQADGEELSENEVQELKDFLRPSQPVGKGRECPGDEQLWLLVAGLLDEPETKKLLAHTETCVWCGKILRDAVKETAAKDDPESPPTKEELAVAATTRLANAENRRAFAERLAALAHPAPMPIPIRKHTPRWRVWGAAAALAAAIGAVGIYVWPTSAVMQTERLLVRAYTDYRPMEMRLPGAGYGPVRTERGAGSLPISRSPDLHEAEARILREIEARPDDPQWMHLQGREHLLEGREDEAIPELERARALRPNDADILSDLGAAWFQKAEKASDKGLALKSFSSAFDLLSQGARLRPDDPALAFNRALAAEHTFAYNEARDAWEAYLRLDSKSEWANEARAHLDEVKKNSTGRGPTPPPQLRKH
jgi:tetratricopeptide (TPR) repeat protein